MRPAFPNAALTNKTLISFDTEFIDTGSTIELISIGLVRADGAELYLENGEFLAENSHLLNDWMNTHVMPKTFMTSAPDDPRIVTKAEIGQQVLTFCTEQGKEPSLWAHYASYDWAALCQLYGPMINIPKGMPYHAMDFRVAQDLSGVKPPSQDPKNSHHALIDARWGKLAFAAFGMAFAPFDPEKDFALPAPAPDLRPAP